MCTVGPRCPPCAPAKLVPPSPAPSTRGLGIGNAAHARCPVSLPGHCLGTLKGGRGTWPAPAETPVEILPKRGKGVSARWSDGVLRLSEVVTKTQCHSHQHDSTPTFTHGPKKYHGAFWASRYFRNCGFPTMDLCIYRDMSRFTTHPENRSSGGQ